MAEVTAELTIVNRLGLHARAAAKLVNLAGRFSARIQLSSAVKSADAKSIMSVMMLAATKGTTLALSAEGDDAETAVAEIEALFADKFGEGE